MSEQRNPRYWISQWYATKDADEPWPGGWYWHDETYNWYGPYDDEHKAHEALDEHMDELASKRRERKPAQRSFSLYYNPLCPYSQKVIVAMHEKGIDFEPKVVDLSDRKQAEHFRDMYPMGKIPLVVLNHGPLIPESSIIIEYLDSLGGERLISADSDVARKVRFKDRVFDLYLIEAAQALRDDNASKARKAEAKRHIDATYDFMNNEIHAQQWMNGDDFSMSDCAAAAALGFAKTVAPFDDYKYIIEYEKRLADRPSVKKMREEAAAYGS